MGREVMSHPERPNKKPIYFEEPQSITTKTFLAKLED